MVLQLELGTPLLQLELGTPLLHLGVRHGTPPPRLALVDRVARVAQALLLDIHGGIDPPPRFLSTIFPTLGDR